MLHRKMRIGPDGATAHQRIHGRRARLLGCEFGERVLGQVIKPSGDRLYNKEERFTDGGVIGVRERSDEIVLWT